MPVICRPADLLEPELDTAREAIKDFSEDIGDVLINAIYPITGRRFLKWKYGMETPTPEVLPWDPGGCNARGWAYRQSHGGRTGREIGSILSAVGYLSILKVRFFNGITVRQDVLTTF